MLQLQKATSELAKTLAEVLESRIKERRGLHSAVLQYLHSNLSTSTATDVFTVPTHEAIRKFIRRLVTRLETTAADDTQSTSTTSATSAASEDDRATEDNQSSESPAMTVEEQMEAAMRQAREVFPSTAQTSVKPQDVSRKIDASIKAEMAVFDSSGQRGRMMEQAYQYLLSVPPTSVEAERAFSAAGVLCTKLRSRLGDDTLDSLAFLRSYYQSAR